MVNSVYYRNFVSGGLYKIEVGMRSGRLGVGYLLEMDYEYRILDVGVIEMPEIVKAPTVIEDPTVIKVAPVVEVPTIIDVPTNVTEVNGTTLI